MKSNKIIVTLFVMAICFLLILDRKDQKQGASSIPSKEENFSFEEKKKGVLTAESSEDSVELKLQKIGYTLEGGSPIGVVHKTK